MIEELEKLRREISDFKAKSSEEIEQFRIKFLG